MDRTLDHHVKWNQLDSERQLSHVLSQMQNLDLKNDMNIEVGLFRGGSEPEAGGRVERRG
jgi:hypothetical protein